MNITQEQIKALKENEKPVCFMDAELRCRMMSMPTMYFKCLQSTSTIDDPRWESVGADKWGNQWGYSVFRLRSDYQPKSGIVECEIKIVGEHTLGFGTEHGVFQLSDVFWMPDFIGFKFENDLITPYPIMYELEGSEVQLMYSPVMGDYEVLHATHVLFRKVANCT